MFSKTIRKSLEGYKLLEKDRIETRKLLRSVFINIYQEFMDSDEAIRLSLLGVKGERICISGENFVDELKFIGIRELNFISSNNIIEFEAVIDLSVLKFDINYFKSKIYKYLSKYKKINFMETEFIYTLNFYSEKSLDYQLDYATLYVLGYRTFELASNMRIINRPKLIVFEHKKFSRDNILYIDKKLIGDSCLMLYYRSAVEMYDSLCHSLFFSEYTGRLILYTKINNKSELFGFLGMLEDTEYQGDIVFNIKGLSFKDYLSILKDWTHLYQLGIRVYLLK